ncbi:uncharacterized protein UHOD_11525 [Ustilago sp. UG-2017b]|nr:uncharacterized protein UHOD_11525 [Ustilago sp. UG-2017b]
MDLHNVPESAAVSLQSEKRLLLYQEIVARIDYRRSPHPRDNIADVVFLTGFGAKCVSVFSRNTQELVWNMGEHFASGGPAPTTWRLKEATYPGFQEIAFVRRYRTRAPPNLWQAGPNTVDRNFDRQIMSPWQMWMAIQHDPKPNTLFILGQRTVLLIKVYKRFFQRSNQSPHQFMEIDFENVKDFYHRIFESTDDGIPVRGWNSRSTWRSRGDGLLSVHEGKAFMINESMALILDLNVDTPALHVGDLDEVSRPFESRLDGQSHEAAEPNVVTDDEGAPSILVHTEWDPPCACQYQFCNFVQMDDVGLFLLGVGAPREDPALMAG